MGQILTAPIRNQLLAFHGSEQYRVGCSQMQGWRESMEDDHNVCLELSGRHSDVAFFGVYDGHAGAEVAHHLARELPTHIGNLPDLEDNTLKQAVLDFDEKVGTSPIRSQGSTCVFALVQPVHGKPDEWQVTVVNTGDSRAMLVRKNGALVELTQDHKPENRMEEARIRKAGGYVQANRVDGSLAMSRAIGDFVYKSDSRISALEQKVIPLPDVTHARAYPGDRLLVICDGIVEALNNKQVAKYVHAQHNNYRDDPAQVMRDLLFHSLCAGSKDNQSGILVVFERGTDYSKPDKFVAGPLLPKDKEDRQFYTQYLKNAEAWGVTGEDLQKCVREANKTMLHDWRKPSQPSIFGMVSSMLPWLLIILLFFIVKSCWPQESETNGDGFDDF